MALCTKWFRGETNPDAKKSLEQAIRNSRFTLGLLTQIIEQEIEEIQANKLDDYSKPGWPYLRADRDGQMRSLKNILKLTKLEKED